MQSLVKFEANFSLKSLVVFEKLNSLAARFQLAIPQNIDHFVSQ
jgi:hypothetical protein